MGGYTCVTNNLRDIAASVIPETPALDVPDFVKYGLDSSEKVRPDFMIANSPRFEDIGGKKPDDPPKETKPEIIPGKCSPQHGDSGITFAGNAARRRLEEEISHGDVLY